MITSISHPFPRRCPRGRSTDVWSLAVGVALVLIVTLLIPERAQALSTRTLITPQGAAATDRFGNSVANAGDVNGDGFDDVIVGAYQNDAGGANAGRAYVYFGGPAADNVPDLTLTGEAASDIFGLTVAGAGDINHDGYADVIVGAINNDAGGADAGRAYVFFGGAAPNATADLVLTGAAPGDWLGYWVAGAGDVNGDGYDDVIVSAAHNDAAGADAGAAYVYFGGAAPNNVADLVLTGEAAGDEFGAAVAGAGDVNGDGFADVLVGANFNDANGASAGRAYLYYGGSTPNAVADLTLTGAAAGDQLGITVAGGDLNADGYSDIAVGAYLADPSAKVDAGQVQLYFGGPAIDNVVDLIVPGAIAGDRFGIAIDAGGDLNGDGSRDLVVGAYLNDAGGADAGRTYAFFGGPIDATADLVLTGEAAGDNYGSSVAAGDLDGDRFDDVITGAWTNDAGGSNAGRAYVTAVYAYQIIKPTSGEVWVAGAPVTVMWRGHDFADLDLSLDGGLTFKTIRQHVGGSAVNIQALMAPDTVGACIFRVRESGADPWESYVAQSRPLSILRPYRRVDISMIPAMSLVEVSPDTVGAIGLGDINGDGEEDMFLGRPGSNLGAGRTDVYLGAGRTATGAPKFLGSPITLVQGATGDGFGYSLAVGDLNGDCAPDLAVGAPRSDAVALDGGRVYVYLGGQSFDTAPDLVIEATAPNNLQGYSVAFVDDMNGDGYADLAVGAPFSNINGSASGKVEVYYGGTAPNATSDMTLAGEAAGDNFGSVLMPLPDGDVDWCERFPWLCPVISGVLGIGAPFNDAGGLNAGAAYLFAGGTSVDATPDLVLRGSQSESHFGLSMTAIGDWNADGLSDFAVGAPDEDIGSPSLVDAGRVRVWTFDPRCFVIDPWPTSPTPWLVRDGDAVGDRFGLTLASTDVDHNGRSDLIVGAPFNDASGMDAGRVYVFGGLIEPDPEPASASVRGLDPDFLIADATAGARLGHVLGVTSVVKAQPQPEPPASPNVQAGTMSSGVEILRRRFCSRRLSLANGSPFGTAEPQPEPYVPAPMLGGDVLAGRLGSSPQLRVYDVNRYHLISPAGTATWNVGALQSVSWSGAEPVAVQMSVDGGASFETIATSPGGARTNSISFRVPHTPTKFGSLRLIPWPPCPPSPFGLTCPPWGFAQTETLFTIQSSVALLNLVAQPGDAGTELTWSTEPGVGPEGLVGYRLYRVASGSHGDGTRIGPELITEERYVDTSGHAGDSYRLSAINGLGEELELGRIGIEGPIVGLRLWPSPVSRQGTLTVAFAAPRMAVGATVADLDVGAFDIVGRRIATLTRGSARNESGVMRFEWQPRTASGDPVRPGLYFVRATAPSVGLRVERKVVVMP